MTDSVRPGASRSMLIADGIRAAAARTPQKFAIVEGERRLAYRALVERVTDAIARRRGALTVIVQKVDANVLAGGFTPLPDSDHYAVVRHVRRTMVKVDETAFFELYR